MNKSPSFTIRFLFFLAIQCDSQSLDSGRSPCLHPSRFRSFLTKNSFYTIDPVTSIRCHSVLQLQLILCLISSNASPYPPYLLHRLYTSPLHPPLYPSPLPSSFLDCSPH